MTRHIAKVISLADEDEHGKVQVRIFPELTDVADASLPWAYPESLEQFGTIIGSGSHSVPLVGSFIYVDVSEDWTGFSYTRIAPFVTDVYPYADAVQALKDTVTELGDQTYPQPDLIRTPDGTVSFHNTDTKEQGKLFPSGMYVHMASDGAVTMNDEKISFKYNPTDESVVFTHIGAGASFSLDANGVLAIDVSSIKFGAGNDSLALFTPLKEILTKLLNHTHVAPTGPTTPAQEPSGTPLSSLSGKLQGIKSELVTTD